MARSKISPEIREFVESRANGRCEYCKAAVIFSPHHFTIDHILPVSAGGSDELSNLAYACFACNRYKQDKTSAVDPFSQAEFPLYNPREEIWQQHFVWDIGFTKMWGLTAIGRATIEALQLNRPTLIRMRQELLEVNRHPPPDDEKQG